MGFQLVLRKGWAKGRFGRMVLEGFGHSRVRYICPVWRQVIVGILRKRNPIKSVMLESTTVHLKQTGKHIRQTLLDATHMRNIEKQCHTIHNSTTQRKPRETYRFAWAQPLVADKLPETVQRESNKCRCSQSTSPPPLNQPRKPRINPNLVPQMIQMWRDRLTMP
jgi:hypothetical protein